MAKQKKGKKPYHRKQQGLMGRSDIPYHLRMAMDRQCEIAANRDHAAKIAMFCNCYALHELEGIGYKRLVRLNNRHLEIGFEVVNGEARAYLDDDGKPMTPKQWHKAREKEGKE